MNPNNYAKAVLGLLLMLFLCPDVKLNAQGHSHHHHEPCGADEVLE
jgi:hypothetical protein